MSIEISFHRREEIVRLRPRDAARREPSRRDPLSAEKRHSVYLIRLPVEPSRSPDAQARRLGRGNMLIDEYRRLPFFDPDLPKELLPEDWLRPQAAALFHQYHDLLDEKANEYFDSVCKNY